MANSSRSSNQASVNGGNDIKGGLTGTINRNDKVIRKNAIAAWLGAVALGLGSLGVEAEDVHYPLDGSPELEAILHYISSSWTSLTRSTTTCEGVRDPKLVEPEVLYVPAGKPIPPVIRGLSQKCNILVKPLPLTIRGPGQITRSGIMPPGLLFLKNPYVVPGGRFNEMYGWDSYFIIRGLLRAGKLDLARGMVENFFFEIEHYGAVLNANRTYYLSRSQPPFLSSMIVAVYEAEKARGKADRPWLEKAYQYARRDYLMWVREPHLAGTTGLSRYYDFGEGPVPEGLHDEFDYYRDVLAYFVKENSHSPYVVESTTRDSLPDPTHSLRFCDDMPSTATDAKCKVVQYVGLSLEYYKGDRSLRESGFDITFRFGPYGAETHHYAPVCLNSLLYKTETDMEKMSSWLGDKPAAVEWHERAQNRRRIVQDLLWNESAGMFFDYDFQNKKLSSYEYASTFYPLWAGIATGAQARDVAKQLHRFEQEGGVAMGTKETGVQWDFPYGWAPIQLITVEGLRRYGYSTDADRISYKFLAMVLANFGRDKNIREKYNVVTDSSNIELAEGYRSNVVGFGWTNAVFLELLRALPRPWINRLTEQPVPDPHR
jgi:alpha,alpha-trehalase